MRTNQQLNACVMPVVQSLETRFMCDADPKINTINLYGTGGDDYIQYTVADYDPQTGPGRVNNWIINQDHGQMITPFIFNINIYGMGGNDEIEIAGLKSGMKVNVYTLTGDDSVSMIDSFGRVNVHDVGGKHDRVYYWAANLSFNEPRTWIQSGHVGSGNKPYWGINFDPGIEQIDVDAHGGDSTVYIDAVDYGTSVHVNGTEGDDQFIIGNGDVDSNIFGQLFIDGGTNHGYGKENNTVVFNDALDGGGDLTTLNGHTYSKSSMKVAPFWTRMQHVSVRLPDQDDYVKVNTVGEADVDIEAGGGKDQITVGNGELGVFGQIKLTIDGGSDYVKDILILDDHFHASGAGYNFGANLFKRSDLIKWQVTNMDVVSLATGNGKDYINASVGNQNLIIRANGGNDTFLGSSKDDTVYGGAGDDMIFGNDGDDYIDGGIGADYMLGGSGVDVMDYSMRTNPLKIDLTLLGGEGETGENDTVGVDFEDFFLGSGNDQLTLDKMHGAVVYGFGGNDTLTGSDKIDYLDGGTGNDVIRGLGAGDVLVGGAGQDKVSGGEGNDLLMLIDGEKDQYYGGNGTNTYNKDPIDFKQSF